MSLQSFQECISVAFRKATEGMDDEELLPNFEERFCWAVLDEERGESEETAEPPSTEVAFFSQVKFMDHRDRNVTSVNQRCGDICSNISIQ
jgi:hypothetical protein